MPTATAGVATRCITTMPAIRSRKTTGTPTTRVYDAAGRVKMYTSFSSPGTMKERREMDYDANGRLTIQENFNSNNVMIAKVQYSYDAIGNISQYQLVGLNDQGQYQYTNT